MHIFNSFVIYGRESKIMTLTNVNLKFIFYNAHPRINVSN